MKKILNYTLLLFCISSVHASEVSDASDPISKEQKEIEAAIKKIGENLSENFKTRENYLAYDIAQFLRENPFRKNTIMERLLNHDPTFRQRVSEQMEAQNKLGIEQSKEKKRNFFTRRGKKEGIPGCIAKIANPTIQEAMLQLRYHILNTSDISRKLIEYGSEKFELTCKKLVKDLIKGEDADLVFSKLFENFKKTFQEEIDELKARGKILMDQAEAIMKETNSLINSLAKGGSVAAVILALVSLKKGGKKAPQKSIPN